MSLHIAGKTDIQLEVVTEFGKGGVMISMVNNVEDCTWGVKLEYPLENQEVGSLYVIEGEETLFDNRFKQILSFPTLEQAQDVFEALRARPKQCTCGLN